MRFLAGCCLLLLVPAALDAQGAAPGMITIGRADSIWSPTIKETRRYLIYTPASYTQSPYQQHRYPVLYLLDGDGHFHSMTGVIQFLSTGMNGTYVVPEMIVVAIPNTDRTRDLTPTKAPLGADGKLAPFYATSGGGKEFLKFLKSELIPHIDSTLRTEPYRVLVGHSLGGITTIDALYTMPDVFNAYVAIDPSLWYDNQVLLKKAKDYFSQPAPPARALFVAHANTLVAGDTAPSTHFRSIGEFVRVVESGNRSGIRYAYKYYGNDDHGSVPSMAEYDALRFIFDGYKLDVRKSVRQPALISTHFDSVSKRLGYHVRPPEKLVDRIAPLDSSSTVALLRLNTEQYPNSAHAFQVLGTALLARRDTASARSALGRALELDPKNQPAKDALARLSGASGGPRE